MTVRHLVFTAAMAMSLFGCRRMDVRDFEIKVPELTSANASQVTKALAEFSQSGLNGSDVKVDLDNRCIKLKYDSMQVAKKNLEMAIALAGFEANGITPESVGAKRASKPAEAK